MLESRGVSWVRRPRSHSGRRGKLLPSADLVPRAGERKAIPCLWEHGLFSQLQEQLSRWFEGQHQQGTFSMLGQHRL